MGNKTPRITESITIFRFIYWFRKKKTKIHTDLTNMHEQVPYTHY